MLQQTSRNSKCVQSSATKQGTRRIAYLIVHINRASSPITSITAANPPAIVYAAWPLAQLSTRVSAYNHPLRSNRVSWACPTALLWRISYATFQRFQPDHQNGFVILTNLQRQSLQSADAKQCICPIHMGIKKNHIMVRRHLVQCSNPSYAGSRES